MSCLKYNFYILFFLIDVLNCGNSCESSFYCSFVRITLLTILVSKAPAMLDRLVVRCSHILAPECNSCRSLHCRPIRGSFPSVEVDTRTLDLSGVTSSPPPPFSYLHHTFQRFLQSRDRKLFSLSYIIWHYTSLLLHAYPVIFLPTSPPSLYTYTTLPPHRLAPLHHLHPCPHMV